MACPSSWAIVTISLNEPSKFVSTRLCFKVEILQQKAPPTFPLRGKKSIQASSNALLAISFKSGANVPNNSKR